jgi:hypothetical protein
MLCSRDLLQAPWLVFIVQRMATVPLLGLGALGIGTAVGSYSLSRSGCWYVHPRLASCAPPFPKQKPPHHVECQGMALHGVDGV